jgi:leucyl aminopeptidase
VEPVTALSSDISSILTKHLEIDSSAAKEGCVVPISLPSKRLVYAPTGPVNRDYDDVRRYSESAAKGVKRALSAGSTSPLLVVVPDARFKNATLVSILGALEALYVPLQIRELRPTAAKKATELGVYGTDASELQKTINVALSLESGRYVARDLGGGDPERMAPPQFASYVKELFANSPVKVDVISDRKVFEKEYPLFAAVDRAAASVARHEGRIIFLTYEGEGPITKTLLPCGKGITYDTGGADIKAGGIMAGMSRDKCGAAAVIGLFQVLASLKPKGIKAIGGCAVARNSVGEECYVADEVIVSRAGKIIRIGNTDAEGRMVMTDVLCKLKEIAVNEVNPHLFTIATLTGHACLAVGDYTALMDNGPARRENFATEVQRAGEELGDMIEISTVRREDFNFIKSSAEGEDLLQSNNAPSSRTPRGHQFPAAFMTEAAGLEKHGIDSSKPIKYSHFDIAGAAGDYPSAPTGVPVLALANHFFGEQF